MIVVGGGASGLMAAGRAAEQGCRVLLLEKMGRVGVKLSMTGKGRCNLTNGGDLATFIASYRHNGKFLYNVFSRFFNSDLISFFSSRGLPVIEERGRRIFPASSRAQDVVRIMRGYAHAQGAVIQIHSPVREILAEDRRIIGVRTDSARLETPKVILATGGASYPQTGSSGDGFNMAEKLGHTIQRIRPALVPLEVEERYVRELQGLGLKNVKVALLADGRKVAEEFGEMLFTHFGISGPIILTLSTLAVDRLDSARVDLSIDLKPALSPEQLDARLIREFQTHHQKRIPNILANLLPRRIVPIFIQSAGISSEVKGNEVPAGARKRLLHLLKDWRLTVKSSRPLEEAIVTAGGISVKEIHPSTMESKIIRGLHFCGEILDVDGKTGGYNLQAAFSTGWVAGEASARR